MSTKRCNKCSLFVNKPMSNLTLIVTLPSMSLKVNDNEIRDFRLVKPTERKKKFQVIYQDKKPFKRISIGKINITSA
jgi:hypothetical protein